MDRVLECLPRGSRIAILRLRSLGDCVLTTPALDILKRYRPDLQLGIFVENRFREIFEGNSGLSEIQPPELPALRRFRPQLCLNFHGGTRSTWMTEFSGAHYRAGFGHYRQQFIYNVQIPRAQEILGIERTVHTAEHLASAMFHLGVPPCEIPRAKLFASPAGPEWKGRRYAVLHAVAAAPGKAWPAGRFLEIASHLAQSGVEPVFTGAPGDDLSAFAAHHILQASLSELKSLLANASLFVGNDSGPAHMAAAFGIPSVVIFGPSDPGIWGPWRTAGEIVHAPEGIGEIPVAAVLSALQRLGVPA
ncbi:MAG: glycosyltransferase family 9 protein [Candidatus Solibacter sp.]